jgi:hypothetical protein
MSTVWNTGPADAEALLATPLPLLVLEVARDPDTGRVRPRSRLCYAVRGAALAQLLLAGRLRDEGGRAVPVAGPEGPYLGRTVEAVAAELARSAPRSWKYWVRSRALRTFDGATDDLVTEGVWRSTRAGLLGRSLPRFSGGEERTEVLRTALRTALLSDREQPIDVRLAVVAAVLDASRSLTVVVSRAERPTAHRRAQALANGPAEAVGEVVRDALVAVVAATTSVSVVVMGAGSGGS